MQPYVKMQGLKPRLRAFRSQLSDAATREVPQRFVEKGELGSSNTLDLLHSMRQELCSLWEARTSSREQLLRHLQDWCCRAEASQILPLQRFSRELRRYA